jgi:hypothetical protein
MEFVLLQITPGLAKSPFVVIDLTDMVDSFYAFRISKNSTMINEFSPILARF